MKKLTIAVLCVIISGCASFLSERSLQEKAAAALGVSPEELTIANRSETINSTSFVVTTGSGQKYACTFVGGKLISGGISTPAFCNETAKNKEDVAETPKYTDKPEADAAPKRRAK